jgi:PAS domain S-box-containing protein
VSALSDEQQVSILLVDDKRENLVALEAVLEPLGHRLVSAGSGVEALRYLLREEFALILLDVQMPELDGFETAELIRRRDRTRNVPIVFLTAISKERGHVFRGYDTGAVDYVFKPFDPAILRSKVSVFVDLYRSRLELQRQAELLRQAELAEERRISEERYRQLADSMAQIVWTAAPEGGVTYLNARWQEYTGLDPAKSLGSAWRDVVHPDDRQEAIALWQRSLETGEPFEVEYRFRNADGRYRWHLGRAYPRRDESGEIVEWVGTATEIHDAKRLEEAEGFLAAAGEALGASLDYRATLQAVAERAVPRFADWCAIDVLEGDEVRQLAIVHCDPQKAAVVAEIRRSYGIREGSGAAVPDVIRTGEPVLVSEVDDRLLETWAEDETQLAALRELGLRSFLCVPIAVRGSVVGAISVCSAESDRTFDESDLRVLSEVVRRAGLAVENALLYREAEERAQASRALATIADGVFLLDGEGIVRLWNPAATAITGLRAKDLVGRPVGDAIQGWDGIAARIPTGKAPGLVPAETIPLEVGGGERWLSIAGVAFEDGTVFTFRDLTEDRVLEELRRDLVATVSHELRTPLAAIYGSALTLQRPDVGSDDDLRDQLLAVIAHESGRLAQIVNDLLLASQLDAGTLGTAPKSCNAREIAEQVVTSARTHLPEGIDLQLDAAKRIPRVRADPGQLRQVLANLVENGVKYSPGGGTVRVLVEPEDRSLRISVSDEGIGIAASELRRIFEKFYRVDPNMEKGIGGTGLGLYISRELVRRVGGRIHVESTPGRGSTFTVEIPLAADKPGRRPSGGAGSRSPASGAGRSRRG